MRSRVRQSEIRADVFQALWEESHSAGRGIAKSASQRPTSLRSDRCVRKAHCRSPRGVSGSALKLKPKPKLPLAPRPKSSGDDGNIRVIRQDTPGLGLPWVPGPSRKRKAKIQPAKAKVQLEKRKAIKTVKALRSCVINGKLEQALFDGPAPRPSPKIQTHEGQPRFEGGIRFVQGGLPFLGKR